MEKRTNGRAKSAPTTNTSRSRSGLENPIAAIMKRIRYLYALSMKAPWNCVRIKHQKLRRHREPPPAEFSGGLNNPDSVCIVIVRRHLSPRSLNIEQMH